MDHVTYGTQVPYMPKEKAKLIRAGLSLYELRARGESYFNKTIMGPYDATAIVFNAQGGSGRTQAQLNWRTGLDAGIIYDADDEGNAVAFMPDDPWYHNRLMLMLDPWLNPVQKHTPQGIVPGYVVQQETEALKNVLRVKIPTIEVFADGKFKDWFLTEEEADAFIEDKKTYAIKFGTNGIQNVPTNKRKYEKRPGTRWEYRPEVMEMINRGRGLQYGWTASHEFEREWKPKIEKEFARIKSTQAPKASAIEPEGIAMAISSWSPEQRARFQQILMGGAPKEEKGDSDVVVETPATSDEPEVLKPIRYKKTEMLKMQAAKLDAIMRKMAPETEYPKMAKPDIIAEILKLQEAADMPVDEIEPAPAGSVIVE